MNSNHDGIKTDLRAHPDVFIPRDDIFEDGDESSYIDNEQNRIRSNSGDMMTRTSMIFSEQQPTLSQSYGGDRSSFLLRQGKLSPMSRIGRYQSVGDRVAMSSISYSGYLYKRSNHPHRKIEDLQDRRRSPYDMDQTIGALPAMPSMEADPTCQNNNNATVAVTPSPANNISTTETESVVPIQLHQQSAFSNQDQTRSDAMNPLQKGLEMGAAFFGIQLENDDNNDTIKNSEVNHSAETSKKIQARVLSTTIDPKRSTSANDIRSSGLTGVVETTKTARRPIPVNLGSSTYQNQSHSSLHDAITRQQSASTMLSASPYPSEFFNFDSSSSRHTSETSDIPQDFYDPEDGHLWRAKFCVLEDGILYFYKNAHDGNSAEAAGERQNSKNSMVEDTRYDNNEFQSSSYHEYTMENGRTMNPLSSVIRNVEASQWEASSSSSIPINARRRSSVKDLSKSPMVRPGMHPLTSTDLHFSDGNVCIWEKRVFMDCIGGVRTAEQQYGPNSFELMATDDDESDEDVVHTLVLKGQNPAEMKEWIFQFHRSLASFMQNFIDNVGSRSNGGSFSGSYNPGGMLTASRSSRNLSSSSLVEPGSIPQSSSEKQLQRLLSTSPSIQHTLSHGHGRTSLKRRMDIKRTPSESASLSSTPDTGDIDYGHHPFAFREPSPNNIQLSPDSPTPPVRVLIPPSGQNFIPAFKPNFEPMSTGTTIPSLSTGSQTPDVQNKELKSAEIYRPKPSTTTGKYIPPHLRSKGKYIPPHLRRKQESVPAKPPQEESSGSSIALGERSHFSPIKSSTAKTTSNTAYKDTTDQLDIINPSTTGFVRGGCADPLLVQGSILDHEYIPKKASRLKKTSAEAFGSYGGAFSEHSEKNDTSLRWEIGAISECGVRDSNEDAYLITNDLLDAFESSSYGTPPQTVWKEEFTNHTMGLFGIFDGHCGNQGARYAVEQLGRYIHDELRLNSANEVNDASAISAEKMESILRGALTKLDVAFCNLCQEEGREWESGATALVAMLANENLVIASLGDCRGFLCRFVDNEESYVSDDSWEQLEIDSSHEQEPLQRCFWREVTTVHSPSAEKERERIENANGWVTTETEIPIGQLRRMDFHDEDVIGILKRCLHYPSSGTSFTESERSTKECKAAPQRIIHISRVCGELAVSRALGDRDFKADFNCTTAAPQSEIDDFKEESSCANDMPWESPLFLPYPENHSREFCGDLVTNTPDFDHIRLGTEGVSDEFLLLACDGLWDVMDADDAIRVARDLLFRKKVTAKKAAARLAELAIHLGSSDNITVLLLRLLPKNKAE